MVQSVSQEYKSIVIHEVRNRKQQMISRIAGGRWLNSKVGLLNMAEYGG